MPAPPVLPYLLLGRHFCVKIPRASLAFAPFGDTLRVVREDADSIVSWMYSSLEAERGRGLYSFGPAQIECLLSPDVGKTHTILLAVVFRLHFAHSLALRPGVFGDLQTQHWLQLFIDTHIDLCLAMHTGDAYSDAQVTGHFSNEETLCTSIIDQWYPHDDRLMHCGALPNVTPCLDFGNVWYLVRARQRVSGTWAGLAHLIASKTQTHKCQVRNFVRILHTYAQKDSALMTIFRQLLVVGLLGNYPTATARPSFETRLHLVLGFRTTQMSERELLLWIYENEQIAFAAVKEFYQYLVSFNPPMAAALRKTTHWDAVRQHVTLAMDIVRSGIGFAHTLPLLRVQGDDSDTRLFGFDLSDASRLTHGSVMAALNEDLRRHHDTETLPLITKLRKLPFPEMMVAEMTRYFNRCLLRNDIVRPQSPIIMMGSLIGMDRARDTIRAMQLVVVKRVERHFTDDTIELRWLAAFGITREGLAVLRELCFQYETTDMPDNSISTRISTVCRHSQLDFCVAFSYFDIIRNHRDQASFKLSRDYAERQITALRAKFMVKPWEPLPESARMYRFCVACYRWLNAQVEPGVPKTHAGIYAIARDKALYNYGTDQICCGRKEATNDVRKQLDTGRYDDLDAAVANTPRALREAKRVRNYLQTPQCASLESVSVDMVGRVQRLGGKLWALCEICASVTQWEGAKFGDQGFTCMVHGTPWTSGTNTSIHEAARTASTAEVRRIGEPARKTPVGAAAGSSCSYCKDAIDGARAVTELSVFDDDITEETNNGPVVVLGTNAITLYILCNVCGLAAPRSPEYLVRKSLLHATIRRIRERRNNALNIKPRGAR